MAREEVWRMREKWGFFCRAGVRDGYMRSFCCCCCRVEEIAMAEERSLWSASSRWTPWIENEKRMDGCVSTKQQSPVTRALSSSLPFAVQHTYSFFFAYSRIRTRDRTKYTLIFLASRLYVYNLISISICIYQFIFCLEVEPLVGNQLRNYL